MRLFNRYCSFYDVALLLGDMALVVLATIGARVLMVLCRYSEFPSWTQWMIMAAVITVIIVLAFYYSDLYGLDQILSNRELLVRFTNGFGIACLIIGGVSYPVQEAGSQNIFLIEMTFIGFGLFAWRSGFLVLLRKAKVRGKLLILGTQGIGKQVSEQLWRHKHLGMEVVGFIGPEAGNITLTYGNPRRVCLPVFPRQSMLQVVESNSVSRVLVAEGDGNFPGQDLIALRLKGIPIEDCHSFYERLASKISITDLHPGWIARSTGFNRTRIGLAMKRLFDILLSAFGLILASPIALFTAIAIKLESPGPILFCQERTGQNEQPFVLYKFRSMFCDAESNTGPIWAKENDPRVTKVGRVIRKLRIDEIPQLLNVLKGEMSFVGPRPERPFFVSSLKEKIPYYQIRFAVKPGLTGWAQVSYGYGANETDAIEKLQYDLYYVKNMSPIFDLQIVFETIKVVLLGRGAQ